MGVSEATKFTYRSARSGSLFAGIILVLLSEGVGIHLWVYGRKPWLAWVLSALTLSTIWWLAMDYRALGAGAITLDDEAVHLRIGKRFSFDLPRRAIATATSPSWRDLPEPGMPQAADYINLTKQATPNVLLTLTSPMAIRVPPGRTRNIQRIAMHLDDPGSFIPAVCLLQA